MKKFIVDFEGEEEYSDHTSLPKETPAMGELLDMVDMLSTENQCDLYARLLMDTFAPDAANRIAVVARDADNLYDAIRYWVRNYRDGEANNVTEFIRNTYFMMQNGEAVEIHPEEPPHHGADYRLYHGADYRQQLKDRVAEATIALTTDELATIYIRIHEAFNRYILEFGDDPGEYPPFMNVDPHTRTPRVLRPIILEHISYLDTDTIEEILELIAAL